MTPLENVLQRLENVAETAEGQYMALCPVHDDNKPSLSISHDNGRVLLHCKASCTAESVVHSIGLKMGDLFDKPLQSKPNTGQSKGRQVAWYDYTDETGNVIFQVVRFDPKGFSQRRKVVTSSSAGWEWNMKGVTRVLYRLSQVKQAIAEGKSVYIVEGEKDVHSLESIGLTATCNAGGAGKWQKSYSETLRGASVVIMPDNDEPGANHAELVADSLHGKAQSIRIVKLPHLPPKGDVFDWVSTGRTAEDLQAIVEESPEWTPKQLDDRPTKTQTDLGNAERLIEAHGDNLRYDVDSGKWLVWNGRLWKRDSNGEVNRLAREVVRSMYDLLKNCKDESEGKALFSHIQKSESAPRLAAMIDLSRYCSGIPVHANDLDSDPMLLCCDNGTIDLRTGQLQPHSRKDLITKLAQVKYDPASDCPRWKQFLSEVFCEDEELIGFVKRMTGYLLTGDTREQAFFLMVGKGSNGKGVFTGTLASILGEYAKDTPVTTFLEKRGDNSSDLASLASSRLVTASEGEDTTSFNESLLKRLTGQDSITARYLYQEYFTFTPTFKILFATNEVPRIRSQNYAMKRRVKLIPFREKFYYAHEKKCPVRDESLSDKLTVEAPGILAWCVEGCIEWQKNGLGMPASMREEVESLFDSMDMLAEFVESRCVLHPGAKVESGVLWKEYQAWCTDEGRTPDYKKTCYFSRALCQRDEIENRKVSNVRYIVGIGLLEGDSRSESTHKYAITAFPESSPINPSYGEFPKSGLIASNAYPNPATADPQDRCEKCGESKKPHELSCDDSARWLCRKCYFGR